MSPITWLLLLPGLSVSLPVLPLSLPGFLVVDYQQPWPSRQLTLASSPTKTFNPPSVASIQVDDSQHNASGLSRLLQCISSILQHQQNDTPQPFSPSQLQPALSLMPTSTQQEPARLLNQSSQQSQPKSVV